MSTPLASGTVISFPIPAYQNTPIQDYFYIPSRFIISAIDLGVVTTVTTTTNMNFVIGQEIRLFIPANCGSYQLNQKTAFVVGIPNTNQVVLEIDTSTNVNPFIAIYGITQPQIIAVGDVNTGVTNSQGNRNNGTTIPGAFKNISPRKEDGTET
jgi:hypothetical protein